MSLRPHLLRVKRQGEKEFSLALLPGESRAVYIGLPLVATPHALPTSLLVGNMRCGARWIPASDVGSEAVPKALTQPTRLVHPFFSCT